MTVGYGDEIMVTGEARRLQEAGETRPIVILDRHDQPRWHELWKDNPRIWRPADSGGWPDRSPGWFCITNGAGCRPYVDYHRMADQFHAVFPDRDFTTKVRDPRLPWLYTDWRATPGELPCVERLDPRGYIVIEPNLKARGCPNKDWGWSRWEALVASVKWTAHPWVQLGPKGIRRLEGVAHIVTPTFLDACRALSGAAVLVCTDGGLHHAAAALGIPAVVIWGGISSPANLGYDAHVNLFEEMDGESPCGQWVHCKHCEEAMSRITPEIVGAYLARELER